MMIDCAALVTIWSRKHQEIEPGFGHYREAGLQRIREPAEAIVSGIFGNQSTGALIAVAPTITGRKARAIRASQDRQPKPKHVSGCVAKQRDHRAWFARTKIEVQNSTCVERQKEARICIGMQDGIPDDQRSR
ncbi:hypothetical protein [Bradyrhizobium sp. CCBAU 53340]|uniref:hypothetical protein n=1 Tax=Bradyrhizobium sp. CCBAU 53340 TaxID=1325112 RepID=UPI00188D8B66|nr:hypothetical protein [Bradyrhizobium sp. CCBAU 53340]